MFLDMLRKKNPSLVVEAAKLHRSGLLEPNTYVIDTDAVRDNAALIKQSADAYRIKLYYMTKQFGRNPVISRLIQETGIAKAVAVDVDEAKTLFDHGLKIGHAGHLVQIPSQDIDTVLAMEPEVITCFSYAKAAEIARKAQERGITQDILLKVVDDGDRVYPGQEGGIKLGELEDVALLISELPNLKIAGLTSFPCFLYNEGSGEILPTHNVETLHKARNILDMLGISIWQLNGPSATCCAAMPLLARYGITHGEPGHAFLGTTPLHAYSVQPEKPAIVYVSEVSHLGDGKAFSYGGGFYSRSEIKGALVADDPEVILTRKYDVEEIPSEAIDYYGTILLHNQKVNVGDTVIYSFRTQIFVTRSKVALLAGLASGKPELTAIYDSQGNLLV